MGLLTPTPSPSRVLRERYKSYTTAWSDVIVIIIGWTDSSFVQYSFRLIIIITVRLHAGDYNFYYNMK